MENEFFHFLFHGTEPYPFKLELHHLKVQVQNRICFIVPNSHGVNLGGFDIYVPRNGMSLVISYGKGCFPVSWCSVDELFKERGDKDAHVWKQAFKEKFLIKPCKSKAVYVIR